MKVSKRGEYGVRALCHLAQRYGEGVAQIAEIARQESIPAKYLETILRELKRSGFVRSKRGAEGGYRLARDPSQILLGDVARVLDGPLSPMASAAELRELMGRNPRQAGYYAVLIDVRDAVSGILDHTSLADVIQRNDPADSAGGGAS